MPNYTAGSTRVALEQPDLTTFQGNGSVVLDSRRTRPLWFDGRFLDARDLEREQNYYLQRQADLGQGPGFAVIHGLAVDQTSSDGHAVAAGSIVIHAGEGITPAGEMVMVPGDLTIPIANLPEQANLDVRFGLSTAPGQSTQTRTGLYVIALQPVEYTANSIPSHPTTVQGPRTSHDGDIVSATSVSLVRYPNPTASYGASFLQSALARQTFVTGNPGLLPDALLPLAVVNLQQGAIVWIDQYLVRRDIGSQFSGVNFGLTDPASQQAFLTQYDLQLQSVVAGRQANGLKANLTASDYFQALPPGGRFPLDAIDTGAFSQVFFPQEMDVRLSIIAVEELPALLEESLSLPPIDLTLPSDAYANLAVFALIPVPSDQFAALKKSLPVTPLNPTLPQVLANREPYQLLQLFQGDLTISTVLPVVNSAWAAAIGSQQYGYYLRRRSDPTFVTFTAPPGVALTSSENPSTFGDTVVLSAAVSPGTSTGNVDFRNGTTDLGTVALAGGVAALTISTLAVGDHPITAVFTDAPDSWETSAAELTQTVNRAVSTIAVVSSANPSIVEQPVTFTANVLPAVATGNVQFLDDTADLGTVALSGGSAPLPAISSLTVGTHSITAVYDGDINDLGSTSAVLAQIINPIPTTVTVTSSLNPSTIGDPVTFTATVSPASATGTVQFQDGSASLGTGTLDAGSATLSISTLAVGTHSITAAYSGDADDAGSTSAALSQAVSKITPEVTLASSLNPSDFGQSVTCTAQVSGSATGSVQFMDGTTVLGSGDLSAGSATLSISSLTVGAHSISALYSGDAENAAGDPAALTQTVNPTPTAITVSSSVNPSTFDQQVTFTASITPASATGNLEFLDGTTSLGTGTLGGGAATLTVSTLTVGDHDITVAYTGDNNDAPSTSPVLKQTVTQETAAVTIASSQNPSQAGQAITFTATLSPSSATGAVQFLDGTTDLGTGPVSGATASLGIETLAVGNHPITAVYSGDVNDVGATSPILTQTVNQVDASVVVTSSADPTTLGESVTFTASVSPGSATGTVSFMDGAAALGPGTLAGGAATLTASSLTVGVHSITAVYNGDANDAAATSPVLQQTVSLAPTTVVLSASTLTAGFGEAITFSATVVPALATGDVQFLDNGTALGSATLSAAVATLTVSTLTVGSHTITADYGGDGNDAPSVSAGVQVTVNPLATSVTGTSSVNPSSFGQAVTFAAQVSPASATGTATFLDGTVVLGSGAITGGAISIEVPQLAIGDHAITVSYGGDAEYAGSVSAEWVQTVEPPASSVLLTSSENPSPYLQSVIFTAVVTPGSATGVVEFVRDGVGIAQGPVINGAANLTVSDLPVGSYSFTAAYEGDANNASSNADPLTQTIDKVGSKMSLTSSPNPSINGEPITFTAHVEPITGTGTVELVADGSINLGLPTLQGGTALLTISVNATTQPILDIGTHSVIAVWLGDPNTLAAEAVCQQVVIGNPIQ